MAQYPSNRAASGRAVRGDAEQRTRNRVLGAVLEHGPVSAAELGEMLSITPAAVRRHLDALTRDGVVEVKRVATSGTGAGRPARRYVLTSRGQSSIGDDYLDIARTALHRLAELAGPGAVEDFAEERFGAMERRYQPVVDAVGDDVAARSRALAEALTRDGFVASAAEVASRVPLPAHMASVQLCQGHCPVQQLAAEFPAFCDTETAVFSRLLGVDVRRLSTLAGGGHVCTTHIPTGRGANPPVAGTPDHHADDTPDASEFLPDERP
ncbi:winged helix-turn-helix transcriptional regulator [Sinomonas sp. JGH33]|uniref:Winged helix-turn-helix transcriptional regulator n=1 Tax=Sinomonas terricola TaxID=3110330 RepID=A0ABU5T3Y6_9MICC|nr:helix-turn-helix domain-containing protein [Sinomonas sp. JGH33]MEA5454380.1 winged helix-turn-helix transcriptional regulator [Sinomonas sp. JGH33]